MPTVVDDIFTAHAEKEKPKPEVEDVDGFDEVGPELPSDDVETGPVVKDDEPDEEAQKGDE